MYTFFNQLKNAENVNLKPTFIRARICCLSEFLIHITLLITTEIYHDDIWSL